MQRKSAADCVYGWYGESLFVREVPARGCRLGKMYSILLQRTASAAGSPGIPCQSESLTSTDLTFYDIPPFVTNMRPFRVEFLVHTVLAIAIKQFITNFSSRI